MSTETIAARGQARATLRASRTADAPLILAAMFDALARGEYDATERHQLEHAAGRIASNPECCTVAEADGRLAGWVVPGDGDLTVLPADRRQGIGRQLLAAGRAMAAADGREVLRLWVRRQPGPEAFASACGLRYSSSLWQMRLTGPDLAAAPEPAFPAGTAIRSLRLGQDEPSFVALVNRIFVDHPSPICLTEDEVRRVPATPGPDAGAILVVEDLSTREMVGFCRVVRYRAGNGSPEGEIRLLGVDRPWRGRGLGRAVTAWGLAELRRRGAEAVALAVEGENESAHRLYAALGFRFGAEWPHWTIAAAPVPAD